LNFLTLFLPLNKNFGNLCHSGATGDAVLEAVLETDYDIKIYINNNIKFETIPKNHGNIDNLDFIKAPVFIPAKEMLSFMEGFNSLYEKYELSFDQTYQDMYLALELPKIKKLPEVSKRAIKKIEDLYKGHFIFHVGGKVTFKTKDDAEYSSNAIAEGFRKIGMLSRLLETGAIEPGVSGPLFWDEPESNMNPKLMKTLVEILLELSRNGQQIIIATHDYVLLNWFDLLMDKNKGDEVYFHSLYRDSESDKVKIESTDNYFVKPNPITDVYNDLLEGELNKK